MSYFDDASLVMIPSGYKTSKVYSVKPTDGTGDLTFTRSNDTATRVNSAGLIEKVRTNVTLYSEQFDNAAWYKAGTTISANALTNPLNGASTADFVVEDTSTGTHDISPVSAMNTTNGVGYTFSVYAKADTRTKILLGLGGSSFNTGGNGTASFDLSSGSIITTAGSATATITSAGGGWYRCVITKIAALTGSFGVPYLQLLDASGNSSYTGNGSKVAGFGWQFETSDFGATPYIGPTLGSAVSVGPVANVPRLDYLGSTCGKLILEPQRTNLSTFSEQFNNTVWFKETGNSVTANTIASPDGYTNADTTTATSTNAINVNQSHTSASSSVHTFSIFLKKNNLSEIQVYIFSAGFLARAGVNLDNGTITDINGSGATITNYGNGWYRCSVQATINTGVGFTIGYLSASTTGSRSVYTYGAQLEVGAYATSYIPTLGAAVTRGADACSKTGISSLIGQTEGTIFFEISAADLGTFKRIGVDAGGFTNSVFIDFRNDGTVYATSWVGSVLVLFQNITPSNPLAVNKYALAYKANDWAVYVNGALAASQSSGSTSFTSALSQFNFSLAGNEPYFGKVAQALLFKTRLTNAQLAELTTI